MTRKEISKMYSDCIIKVHDLVDTVADDKEYIIECDKVWKPYTEVWNKFRKSAEYVLEEIPSYGDHMKFEDFEEACRNGWFIDYDGSGVYATEDKISDIAIYASDFTEHNNIRADFSHVMWYNR